MFLTGTRRESAEELEFSNFNIFEDLVSPYSTFNFTYPHLAFERLSKLMEFNTKLHIEDIKDAIADYIEVKRTQAPRLLFQLEDISSLPIKNEKTRTKLLEFIQRLRERVARKKEAKNVEQNGAASCGDASCGAAPCGE